MKSENDDLYPRPSLKVQVVEPHASVRRGWTACRIGENVAFYTDRLESYCIATWEPVIYDALLVAAAAEFSDRTQKRPAMSWQRSFDLLIPVHEPERWRNRAVSEALQNALSFLTGDEWRIEFCGRRAPLAEPKQQHFDLPSVMSAVIPFSDGMDSRCVAGILDRTMGDKLIRVRLGSRIRDAKALPQQRQPFTSVPYRVQAGRRVFVESTARSRGFKFAMVSGLTAYLTKTKHVIVSESGQGALGPAMISVGQGYEDYRSHPLFTDRMGGFLKALLQHEIQFDFTQLWQTKAETLRQFASECKDGSSWSATWSCWQQTRQVSVDGKKRQCGICAACLLRRMSVHAAGLKEAKDTYVWENLSASSFEGGAAPSFPKRKITRALREYAIAGTLHLDHLAQLRTSEANATMLSLFSFQLAASLGMKEEDVRCRLDRLLAQHETEWKGFIGSLGKNSFLGNWAGGART
jgi:7-cyano-7-deazaguanine synthase in queuosine biosynthesis